MKVFTNNMFTYVHVKKHQTELSQECPACTYKTFSREKLKYHLHSHLNPKPFVCMICEYASTSSHGLKRHIRNAHGEKKVLQCEMCEKTYSSD